MDTFRKWRAAGVLASLNLAAIAVAAVAYAAGR